MRIFRPIAISFLAFALCAPAFGVAPLLLAELGRLILSTRFHHRPHVTGMPETTLTGEKVGLPNLVGIAAKQACQNWAWAADVETILHTQNVNLDQNYWVMKADGGEVCKDQLANLAALGKVIDGEYVLADGRRVRLEATSIAGAPTNAGPLVLAPRVGRPLIFVWKGHPYLYRGMNYDEYVSGNGQRDFVVRQLELADPYYSSAEKQIAAFDREKDDAAEINGMMDVVATPIEGSNWLHPEKELENPPEIYFPK